jgi:hypothetical protein
MAYFGSEEVKTESVGSWGQFRVQGLDIVEPLNPTSLSAMAHQAQPLVLPQLTHL